MLPQYVHRLEELSEAVEHTPMIGEIGLDYHFVEDAAEYPAQRTVLKFFLAAAGDQDKIVTLHTKGAEEAVLDLLDRYDVPRAIVHWYSGPLDIFRDLVARGAYFTVGVEVLHAEHIQTLAREIPIDRLLTETDNPGGPKGYIGKFGTPALVKEVVRGIAEVRGTTVEAIGQAIQANLLRLVRNDPKVADTYDRVLDK